MFQWSEYAQRYWMQDAKYCVQVEREVFENAPRPDQQNFSLWLNRRHWKSVTVVTLPPVLDFHKIDLDLEWEV